MSSGRAAARLRELINSSSQKVALEATKYSLSVAGIRPAPDAHMSVNLQVTAGWVIDLSGDRPKAEPKIVEGAGTVIDAKPVE